MTGSESMKTPPKYTALDVDSKRKQYKKIQKSTRKSHQWKKGQMKGDPVFWKSCFFCQTNVNNALKSIYLLWRYVSIALHQCWHKIIQFLLQRLVITVPYCCKMTWYLRICENSPHPSLSTASNPGGSHPKYLLLAVAVQQWRTVWPFRHGGSGARQSCNKSPLR